LLSFANTQDLTPPHVYTRCHVHCVAKVTKQKWHNPNIEAVYMYLEIIWIDFDDIWQKYSTDSRIEIPLL